MNQSEEASAESIPQPGKNSADVIAAPPLTDRAIWLEVLAVLAIGVLPNLALAIVSAIYAAPSNLPYWVGSMELTLRCTGVSFAVLYLISRSGEPWSTFGLAVPRVSDLLLGLLISFVYFALWNRVFPILPTDLVEHVGTLPFPLSPTDFIMMFVSHAANGFTEELVVRAYLITRLVRLLNSKLNAITLSAFVFASYHVYYDPGGGLIFILLVGFVYGGIYLVLRRIWPLALGHMLVNIFIETAGSAS
jgi:membrane protease YdiL (CAAX protease family)